MGVVTVSMHLKGGFYAQEFSGLDKTGSIEGQASEVWLSNYDPDQPGISEDHREFLRQQLLKAYGKVGPPIPPELLAVFTDPTRIHLLHSDVHGGYENALDYKLLIDPPPLGDAQTVPEPSSLAIACTLAVNFAALVRRGRRSR
jgi:hypothetical protein